jgi:hypothetical protein
VDSKEETGCAHHPDRHLPPAEPFPLFSLSRLSLFLTVKPDSTSAALDTTTLPGKVVENILIILCALGRFYGDFLGIFPDTSG